MSESMDGYDSGPFYGLKDEKPAEGSNSALAAGSITDKPSESVTAGIDWASGDDFSVAVYPNGVECGHVGCRNHITHPCEGCGRVGANWEVYVRIDKHRTEQ